MAQHSAKAGLRQAKRPLELLSIRRYALYVRVPVPAGDALGESAMDPTRTILLVEDDPDVRAALGLMLRTHGYEVRTANHGLDGLRKLLDQERPSAIVVDLMMPVMDGWDFLQQCPEGIPIVVISGAYDVERTRTHPDVAAVIQKPVTMEALVGAVAPLVNRNLSGNS
jgi:DNA-binding response OmpR family regulator